MSARDVNVMQRIVLERGRAIKLVIIRHDLVKRTVEEQLEHADGLSADLAQIKMLDDLGLKLSLVSGIVKRILEVK